MTEILVFVFTIETHVLGEKRFEMLVVFKYFRSIIFLLESRRRLQAEFMKRKNSWVVSVQFSCSVVSDSL